MDKYNLQLTTYGMVTCDAVSTADYGDGLAEHRCPDFHTVEEVLEWLCDNADHLKES